MRVGHKMLHFFIFIIAYVTSFFKAFRLERKNIFL